MGSRLVIFSEEKFVSWFYRILNHAITDVYRRRLVEKKYVETSAEFHEPAAEPEPEDEAVLCGCFRELIPALKPEYAELIVKLELAEGDPAQVAENSASTATT